MVYDVVIAGAGPAGFGAAMGAARKGKKVLLFDRNSGLEVSPLTADARSFQDCVPLSPKNQGAPPESSPLPCRTTL